MTRILRAPLHCFLLAGYFPLWLLSANLELFAPWNADRAVLLNLLLAGSALLLFRLILRNWHRAGLAASLVVVLLFGLVPFDTGITFYGMVAASPGWQAIAAATVAVMAATGARVLVRPRAVAAPATLVLNAISAALLVIPAATVASSRLHGTAHAAADEDLFPGADLPFDPPAATYPSIFHVVLDGYARADVLARLYGFDNEPFIAELRRLGFFVAGGSASPYSQTLLAMNAVFSAEYASGAPEPDGTDSSGLRRRLADRLSDSPVRRALQRLGYRSVAVETDYYPARLRSAELVETGADAALPNLFEQILYERTPLMGWHDRLFGRAEPANTVALRRALDPLRLKPGSQPIFFYNHLVAPHPPFAIDRDGAARPGAIRGLADGSHLTGGDRAARERYRAGYIEKLLYVNGRLPGYLRHLIATVPGDKIIIVHGDHGGGMWLDHESAARSCLWERMSPLLAVYASDGRLQRAMTDEFNLVNLYRLVFNIYFGTDLALLDNRSYFSPWSAAASLQQVLPAQGAATCPPWPQTRLESAVPRQQR